MVKGGLFGFTNDDIYFMEICLFNQLCENNDELFRLDPGENFVCKVSEARFAELERLLRTPAAPESEDTFQCTMEGPKRLDELLAEGMNVSTRKTISCRECEELHAQTPGDCSDMRNCESCDFCKRRRVLRPQRN